MTTLTKLESALKLIKDGDPVTKVAKQLGLGRSTLYRELQYFKATD
jgi:DNA-binding phage protein